MPYERNDAPLIVRLSAIYDPRVSRKTSIEKSLTSMNKLRAFVVEDSPIILESLTLALEEIADVSVVGSAVDEQGALAWMNSRTNGCDLVIIDIFLKTGSGLGVLNGMSRSRHRRRASSSQTTPPPT